MNSIFKKEDLKAGMVVELENNKENFLAMIYPYNDELCISCKETWFPIRHIDNNLINCGHSKINKVYSVANTPMRACELSTEGRQLLWERKEEPEYMTFWEAKEYNFVKHKDDENYACLINKTDRQISVVLTYLKDLDKKVWLGTNSL